MRNVCDGLPVAYIKKRAEKLIAGQEAIKENVDQGAEITVDIQNMETVGGLAF